MFRCKFCNKKAKRLCPSLGDYICSYCCGSKRQFEITCQVDCDYLNSGEGYQIIKEISKEIDSSFNNESEDIFQYSDEAVMFVVPLEKFFVEKFYNDLTINDNNIYNALIKLYSHRTRNTKLVPDNKCEKIIFDKFLKLNEEFSDISNDLKSKVVLRLLKSIRVASGGIFGNRNYLDIIDSQFRSDGRWSRMFGYE